MRATSAVLVCVVAAVCLLSGVSGLYEEQAGAIDWYRENLGAVRFALYPTQSSIARVRGSTVLVGTEAGVLALLRIKSGAIVWRQVLPSGESIESMSLDAAGTSVLTVSGAGRLARAWALADGSLLWESATHARAKEEASPAGVTSEWRSSDAVFFTGAKQVSGVASLYGNVVSAVVTESGAPLWTYTVRAGRVARRLVAGGNDKLYVITSSADASDSSIGIIALSASKGEAESEKSASVPFAITATNARVAIVDSFLVAVSPSGGEARVIRVSDGTAQTVDLKTLLSAEHQLDVVAGSIPTPAAIGLKNTFVLRSKRAQSVLKIADSGSVSVLQSFDVKTGDSLSLSAGTDKNQNSYIIRSTARGGATLSIDAISVESGSVHALTKAIDFSGRGGRIAASFAANVIPSGSGSADLKYWHVLIVAADESVSVIAGGELAWTREEALASIRNVEFIELPIEHAFNQDSFPSLAERIVPQTKQLIKTVTDWAKVAESLIKTQQFPPADPNSEDQFGFRKLIVVATDAGKLFGLHTEGGAPVWSVVLPECVDTYRVWRLFDISPRTVLLVSRAPNNGGGSVLHTLNALTGAVLTTTKVDYDVIESVDLSSGLTAGGTGVLLIDSNRIARVVPSTPALITAFDAYRSKVHFFTADTSAGALKGWAVSKAVSGESGVYETANTWTVAFPAEIEQISSLAGRQQNEYVHSAIRMITSAEEGMKMVYKYINPHLVAVATVRDAPTSALRPVIKKTTDPSVNIYLIDTVTGAVVEKLIHRHATGPVNIIQSENVVLYHYWNINTHQYEVSVLELYQDRDSGRDDDSTFSSYSAPVPQLTQQTYSLRTGVKAMGVTSTHHGITSKDFLFGLNSDQLLIVSKHFVDPRRPTEEPTPAEREDGLVPYHPELPSDPVFIVTYNRTVTNLRGIVTTHALLESTSLVFAFGLDLFYTRVTPSQTFDLLNEDFNYGFLVLTVLIVAVPIVITRRWAKQKELATAWK